MKVRLGDVFNRQITGEWGSECIASEKGIKVLRTTNFTFDGQIDFKDVVLRNINTAKAKEKRLRSGDILLEKSGGTEKTPVGRVVFCDESIDRDIFLCNNFTQAMRVNPEIAFSRYVFYFMWYFHNSKGTELLQNKTTGIRNLQIKSYLNIEIPLPSLEEQRHIAAVLDKVSELISKRKAQLDKLDELVKSRFVEMFGDPVSGVEKWPIHNLEAVAEAVDPQPSHRTPPAEQNGVPYISVKDCDYETGKINFEGARKVSKAILEEHLNRYTLHDGDFIIGKIGTIGKPVFVPARKDYTLSANVVLIKPKIGLVSPHFLKYSFMSSYVTKQFEDAQNSTSQAAFGIQKVRTIKVMNPDTKVQNEFEILAKQVNKTKSTIQKSLEQLETLKKALMQKYFG